MPKEILKSTEVYYKIEESSAGLEDWSHHSTYDSLAVALSRLLEKRRESAGLFDFRLVEYIATREVLSEVLDA